MISKQKEYYIRLFIKISKMEEAIESSIKFFINLTGNMCNLAKEEKKEVEQKITKEDYIKNLMPIIDENFSTEELKELINFYGSILGRKILDKKYLEKIQYVGDNFIGKIQSELLNFKK